MDRKQKHALTQVRRYFCRENRATTDKGMKKAHRAFVKWLGKYFVRYNPGAHGYIRQFIRAVMRQHEEQKEALQDYPKHIPATPNINRYFPHAPES